MKTRGGSGQRPSSPQQRSAARRTSEPVKAPEKLWLTPDHEALAELRDILNTSDTAILFLDRRLTIKLFTAAARPLIGLRSTDIGRPFSDVADRFTGGDLLADARSVLETLAPVKRFVGSTSASRLLCSIAPYWDADGRVEGVVICLCNMSDLAPDQEMPSGHPTSRTADSRVAKLTPRQHEIMDFVVAGLANKEIAFRLGINQRTVESHRATIMKKLDARSLADLIRLHIAAGGV